MCEFKPPKEFYDPDYQCRHPARQDGLCLFHLFKPTEEQKQAQAMAQEARTAAEAIEEEFRQAFSKLLEDEEKNPETGDYDFRYFYFPAVDLRGRRFAKPLLLTRATFSEEADFGEATFSGMANFWEATFGGVANFWRATFSGGANFWGAAFNGETYFAFATINGETNFTFAIFNGEADFQGATFSGKANFAFATFSGKANFNGATFSGKANLRGATFSGKANLRGATFNGEAQFWGATFSGEADFGEATFNGEAQIVSATFSGPAEFSGENFEGECFFMGVTLDEKARVVFEKANLEQASFLDTNLEQIHFRDVEWPCKGKRQVLWDEFPHKGGQSDYEKVAENYRQLVLNYEAKRDFDTAEDFHIGEMEMRRKKKRKKAENKAAKAKRRSMKTLWHCWGVICKWANGYSIYKLLSNYGTSYLQGFLVLLVWLVLFSGIFLCSGLKPSKEHKDSLSAINYELCLHTACQRASRQQKISDSASAFLFTLSLLTFQKERLYEPANRWTQFWMYIAVFLLTGQTALVLFAIRRRFKR